MKKPVVLAIDAMSGDHGYSVAVDAVVAALRAHAQLSVILVGEQGVLRNALRERKLGISDRVVIEHAPDVVGMQDLPSKALRGKRDSSMRRALDLVKEGRARAAVSAGNTGALMAMARFVLKMLPGIDRPAIISAIPSVHGHTHMLDLGANAECSADQLFQFGIMGSALATAVHGVERPKLGLLNIGEEEIKGSETIRRAAALLEASPLNYIGFVEGDGIFLDDIDVVVCDGFVGNVALKTGEGVARLIRQFLHEEFTRNVWHKMAAVAAYPALASLGRRIDPRRYNGASFLGLQATVVKSHGGADALAFGHAIEVALQEVEQDVPARIMALLASTSPLPPQEARQA